MPALGPALKMVWSITVLKMSFECNFTVVRFLAAFNKKYELPQTDHAWAFVSQKIWPGLEAWSSPWECSCHAKFGCYVSHRVDVWRCWCSTPLDGIEFNVPLDTVYHFGDGGHTLGIEIVPGPVETRPLPPVTILNLIGLGQTLWA